MKNIKNILDNYKENPSEDVWEKLSERLDAEMPVTGKQVSKVSTLLKVLGVAAVAAVLSLSGFFVYRAQNPKNMSDSVAQVEVENADSQDFEIAKVDNNQEVVISEAEAEAEKVENSNKLETPVKIVEKAKKENASAQAVQEPQQETPSQWNGNTKKAEQIVLPKNSMLARQMQNDPVLKNVSTDDLDISVPVKLAFPNIFTPNGDGVNDFFVIDGLENFDVRKLVIRDRFGKVVYSSNDYRNNWGAENCQEGTYNYELTFSYKGIENTASGKVRVLKN